MENSPNAASLDTGRPSHKGAGAIIRHRLAVGVVTLGLLFCLHALPLQASEVRHYRVIVSHRVVAMMIAPLLARNGSPEDTRAFPSTRVLLPDGIHEAFVGDIQDLEGLTASPSEITLDEAISSSDLIVILDERVIETGLASVLPLPALSSPMPRIVRLRSPDDGVHFWLNPQRFLQAQQRLARVLALIYPDLAAVIAANQKNYAEEVAAWSFRTQVAWERIPVPQRRVLVDTDTFFAYGSYFAVQFIALDSGLISTSVAPVNASALPSLSHRTQLDAATKGLTSGLPIVITEASDRHARDRFLALLADTEVCLSISVLQGDTVSGVDYLAMMENNTRWLRDAVLRPRCE